MNTDKYFKPSFRDLYEGFEFEAPVVDRENGHATDRTITIRFSFNRISAIMNYDTRAGFSIPDNWIVPYLTGVKIEAEGFIKLITPPFYYQQTSDVELQWFQKDQWVISFAESTRMLGIYVYTPQRHGIYFSGVCRDINRFRLLFEMVTDQQAKMLDEG